jgi:hypothetical protein
VKSKAWPKPGLLVVQAGRFPLSPPSVPLFPRPDESETVVPLPSSNRHNPTTAGAAGAACSYRTVAQATMMVVNNGVKFAFIELSSLDVLLGLNITIPYQLKTTLSLRVRVFLLSVYDCVKKRFSTPGKTHIPA